jgi:hypothetical protein
MPMNASGCPRLVPLTYGLALVLCASTALPLFGEPATIAPPVASTGAADQVHPDRRIKRLGQLYEEVEKLLAEHRSAVSTLRDLETKRGEATAMQSLATQQLVPIQAEAQSLRGVSGAVTPRLPRLTAQENLLQQQIYVAQRTRAELQRPCADASQRLTQLSEAMQRELPRKRQEWLWLCDPLGKLGSRVHRDSIDFFSKQIVQDRDFALSYLGRGFARLHTDQSVEALDDLSKVVLLDKDMADVAAATRGWICARMQRDSDASTEFGTAIKLSPASPFVELALGQACADRHKINFAEEHLRKAVDLGGHLPQAREALAFFLATRRQSDPISVKNAIQQATKACEMTDWRQWVYLDTLAMACAAAGDFQLAERWGGKALEYAPREYETELRRRLELYARKQADPGQAASKTADTVARQGVPAGASALLPGAAAPGKRAFSQFGLPKPQFAQPADEAQYVASIREFLKVGLGTSSDGIGAARPRYESALPLCGNDPRLFYAWGLVCLKQRNVAEAQQQLEMATGMAEGRYLPAWQALVRVQILQGTADMALQTLVRLADALELPENRELLPEEKEECANWLGRVITFIEQNAADPSIQEGSVKDADARVSESLDPSLRAAYQNGKRRRSQRQQTQRDTEVLRARQDQMHDEKAKTQQDAEELKTTQHDKQKELQRNQNELQIKYAQLQAEAARLNRTISDNETSAANSKLQGKPSGIPLGMQGQLKKRLDLVQGQLAALERQNRALNQAGSFLMGQSVAQMQGLGEKERALEKRRKGFGRAQAQARRGMVSRPKAKSAAAIEAALDRLFPLDCDAEAQRIVASYAAYNAPETTPSGPAPHR